MKVLVTGATGFVGSAVVRALKSAGHQPIAVSRSKSHASKVLPPDVAVVEWDFQSPTFPIPIPEAVVHLAGESLFAKRWNQEQKKKILDSRVQSTKALVALAKKSQTPSQVFICASAIGYYGDRGDEVLTETSSPGNDFLSQVCQQWEQAAREAESAKIRTVRLRNGLVLGKGGGALEKMLPVFKTGAGGPVGSGKQWMSWIHLTDLCRLIVEVLRNDQFKGVFNAASPRPVVNRDFAEVLGKLIHRPALIPTPAFILKMVLGEVSEVLLSSQRVVPRAAEALGFRFQYDDLESALQACLA